MTEINTSLFFDPHQSHSSSRSRKIYILLNSKNKMKQLSIVFNTRELFIEFKDSWALTLVGPIRENLVLDPQAGQHLDNLFIFNFQGYQTPIN